MIHYQQIGNGSILNAFKNNFDRFLVYWACFENIMQHQKYIEPRKKGDDGYDLNIFIVINVHKKHLYVFLSSMIR
jgi:hypothetical protein